MTAHEAALLRDRFGADCDLDAYEKRMADGEPLAYILGEWYFWDETYTVSPDVLIPRPDTEHLVEAAIKALKGGGRLLDLCCGSGCVAISALLHSDAVSGTACDISDGALEITRINAVRNKVNKPLEIKKLDVLDRNALAALGRFDVVASNPPYIRTDVIPTLETVQSEPVLALDGGSDGLIFYRALVSAFELLVNDGGVMLLEIGYDQGDELRLLCAEYGLDCMVTRDYGGNERVVKIERKHTRG